VDELKKAAAMAAVEQVPTGSIVGLGTGSTLAYFIRDLGERIHKGSLQIIGVPTSLQARLLAKEYGIPIRDPMDVDHVDITIDGADEVDPAGNVIKGGGGAHVTEKLVAALSERFVIVVDETKLVQTLGEKFPVPVEVIAPALSFALKCLEDLGGQPALRTGAGKIGPVISDLGNPIIDAHFGPIADAGWLDRQINNLPGVVGHGLFIGMAHQVIVARPPEANPRVEIISFERATKR